MLNTACIGKVLGMKIPQRIKWIKFLPSWYLHLTNRYCLYVKILCPCFRAYKQYTEFITQWDNKKHITDGRKRYLSQKEETIFIGWGRVLWGRSSNTGMNPYHILKLCQFIIGSFSCYSHIWHIKTKLDKGVSKIYFLASSDKGVSHFIMMTKRKCK